MTDVQRGSGRRRRPGTAEDYVDKVGELALRKEDKPQSHRTVCKIAPETDIRWSSAVRILCKDLRLQ